MLWIYQRGPDELRVETSFDNATGEYKIITSRGPSHVDKTIERFRSPELFRVRLEGLEQEIAVDRWESTGSPIILRDGWKIG